MTHSAVLLLVDALAVFRLTRLIMVDTVTARLRQRLIGRRPGTTRNMGGERIMVAARPKLAELLACPWCLSVWLAVAVTACQVLAPGVWIYGACVLAFSAIAGLLLDRP